MEPNGIVLLGLIFLPNIYFILNYVNMYRCV